MYGASQRTENLSPQALLDHTNSREFNRMSRPLWLHLLFDRMASLSTLNGTEADVDVYRNAEQIAELKKNKSIHYVCDQPLFSDFVVILCSTAFDRL